MHRILKNCVWGGLIGLFAVAVLGRTAGAETLKWRQGLRIAEVESTPVGNMPGRVVGTGESKGVAFFENGEVAATVNMFTFFYTDGSGPAVSFGQYAFEDGATFVIEFKVNSTANKRDKTTEFKGEFSFIYGSGRFAGIKGSGTASGKRFAPLGAGSVLYFDYTGNYTLSAP
ncbi:MAG: hypothetical protein ACE10C_11385 [Candidatus Binatia bacterium]